MLYFFLRRLLTSSLVVLVSTYIMYVLVDLSIDPLFDLRTSTNPNKQGLIDARIAMLRLDEPVSVRYLDWLQGALGCTYGSCDLGADWRTGQAVTDLLAGAILVTLQLVMAATIIAIVVGIFIGIASALRQYTGFDYGVTFLMFFCYSLPIFVVAVLLKGKLAIDFNDWLADPHLSWTFIIPLAGFVGLVVAAVAGGSRPVRLRNFGIGGAVVIALCTYANVRDLFVRPSQGTGIDMLVVALLAVLIALAVTVLSTGLHHRRSLGSALTVAALGVALYYPMLYFWAYVDESWPLILGLGLVAIGVGMLVGFLWGGPDRGRNVRTAAITAFLVSIVLFVDRVLQSWYSYVNHPRIHGRAIATTGPSTPNLDSSFWIHSIDKFTHLVLPSLALVLISLASYTRYIRASTLDVLTQDYIRTARSKGLTERTVVMRHAVRNALLPLAAIVPVDIITVVGGALITEYVFGWYGMGYLFVHSLDHSLQDPIMGYIVVVGILAVFANFVADLTYAVLDPRIRVAA